MLMVYLLGVVLIHFAALVLYRASTVINRLPEGKAPYSRDLFLLPPGGATVLMFGFWRVLVRPRPLWNVLTFLLFPLESTIQETSGVIRFTHYFSARASARSDLTYLTLAALLFPLKLAWNLLLVSCIRVLRLFLDTP